MRSAGQPGVYVERLMDAPPERIWDLTQTPAVHQRWDLGFTSITHLPRTALNEPQQFLYETRIGLGLAFTVPARVSLHGVTIRV